MSTRNKVLLTIFLAIIYWCLFGCGGQEITQSSAPVVSSDTTEDYLKQDFDIFNQAYFQNRLQKPQIDFDLQGEFMATTWCHDDGTACVMRFNKRYLPAKRVSDSTILHEMCHEKVWARELGIEHGKLWRSCMLQLDSTGAFRLILIDNYREDLR